MASNETARTATGPGVGPDGARWHRGWLRVAIALVLAGQGMAFGLAVNLTPPTGAAYWVMHGGLLASALAVLGLLGGPLLRECGAGLRAGRITVDLLFLVTLGGALAVSVFSTLRGGGPVFYELVAILLAIYTVGKLLGASSRSRALRAVENLRAEFDVCHVLDAAGASRRVAIGDVRPGDRVLVAAGEAITVDGRVRTGEGLIATTPLTGEPDPVTIGPGADVLAGMRSLDAAFVIDVKRAAGERRLDTMLRELETARLRPSRLQVTADRLAARFVPLVLGVSVATFVFWLTRAGVTDAVENGLAVLVVACPCALGLATPLGVWAGLVRLGRLGIVARSGDFLEALAHVDRALIDKTGTLCEPDLQIARFETLPTSPLPPDELRAVLAAAEGGISHPIAAALHGVGDGTSVRRGQFEFASAQVIPGRGIRARVRSPSGATHELLAGTAELLVQAGVDFADARRSAHAHERGWRQIFVAVDGRAAARIELTERPRERAGAMLDELRALGVAPEIVTGDPAFPADVWPGIARRVGQTPEEKSAYVCARQSAGERVLFVGDGLNDAPALAVADASIALRHGAELARSNALAVVAGQSLGTLPEAVRVARAVIRAINRNLLFAAIYNTAGMAIAAAGWLHPVVAALLMAGSSAIVATRVLRAAEARVSPAGSSQLPAATIATEVAPAA